MVSKYFKGLAAGTFTFLGTVALATTAEAATFGSPDNLTLVKTVSGSFDQDELNLDETDFAERYTSADTTTFGRLAAVEIELSASLVDSELLLFNTGNEGTFVNRAEIKSEFALTTGIIDLVRVLPTVTVIPPAVEVGPFEFPTFPAPSISASDSSGLRTDDAFLTLFLGETNIQIDYTASAELDFTATGSSIGGVIFADGLADYTIRYYVENGSAGVPEPTTIIGTAVVGLMGAAAQRKRKALRKQ